MNNPELYDKSNGLQKRDAEDFIPYFVSQMKTKPFEMVLDFGCGTGYGSKNILFPTLSSNRVVLDSCDQPDIKICAVDISKNFVEFARANYAHPQIAYIAQDLMKEGVELNYKFDKIFSMHVLNWISDYGKLLGKLYDLLKPSGEIAFYYKSKSPVYAVYDVMQNDPTWGKYHQDAVDFIPKTFYIEDPAEYMHGLMTSIGYEVQESSVYNRKFHFGNLDVFLDAAMAANPFIHRIPEAMRELYKEDFRECFLKVLDNSTVTPQQLSYSLVVVRAQKPSQSRSHHSAQG